MAPPLTTSYNVRFLLLAASAKTTTQHATPGSKTDSPSLEHLLLGVGRISRRVRSDTGWNSHLDAYDVIFLEVKDDNDIAYCHELRRVSLKPLFLYGWNVPVTTWIHGLQSGADAYLDLPTTEEVLNARLRAVLRRSQTPSDS